MGHNIDNNRNLTKYYIFFSLLSKKLRHKSNRCIECLYNLSVLLKATTST